MAKGKQRAQSGDEPSNQTNGAGMDIDSDDAAEVGVRARSLSRVSDQAESIHSLRQEQQHRRHHKRPADWDPDQDQEERRAIRKEYRQMLEDAESQSTLVDSPAEVVSFVSWALQTHADLCPLGHTLSKNRSKSQH